jgi:hypothetical protein
MPAPPSTELVAIAWLKTLPGIPTTSVATTLPGDSSTWSELGFVQVSVVGGSPEIHNPRRSPVVQIDCWACNPNSEKTPWGKAGVLVETIVNATYLLELSNVTVSLTPADTYDRARVLSAYPLTEPRRVPGDEAGFARLQFDMALSWVVKVGE